MVTADLSVSEATESFVLCELAGSTYGLSSASVQHIGMLEHVTLVPNAHPAIEGVVFSRGQMIPALNLRARFGFPREPHTLRTRLIFVQVQRRIVGLIVDTAREFRRIATQSIRPIEATLTGVSGNYLTGVATLEKRLVLLLNLEAVLDVGEWNPGAEDGTGPSLIGPDDSSAKERDQTRQGNPD